MTDLFTKITKVKPNKKNLILRKHSILGQSQRSVNDDLKTLNVNFKKNLEVENDSENKKESNKLTIDFSKGKNNKKNNNNKIDKVNHSSDEIDSISSEDIKNNNKNNTFDKNILSPMNNNKRKLLVTSFKNGLEKRSSTIQISPIGKPDKKLKKSGSHIINENISKESNFKKISQDINENNEINKENNKNEEVKKKLFIEECEIIKKKPQFFGNSKKNRPEICRIKQKYLHKYPFKSIDYEKSFSIILLKKNKINFTLI